MHTVKPSLFNYHSLQFLINDFCHHGPKPQTDKFQITNNFQNPILKIQNIIILTLQELK